MAVGIIGVGGGLNAYIPSTNALATGALQVEFTRTVNSFGITRYSQIVPVSQMTGYWLRQVNDDNMRILNGGRDYQWPLGQDVPTGIQNQFEFVAYTTNRKAYPFYIPTETTRQAAWDVVAQHARAKAQLGMTNRTRELLTLLTTTTTTAGSYPWNGSVANGGSYAATTANLPGNSAAAIWGAADNANIQQGIQQVLQYIAQLTGSVVRPQDVIMVIGPETARVLSTSIEVRNYVKNYPAALPFLQGSDVFSRWGLPPTLFGLGEVVVEDAVQVTSARGAASTTKSFILGSGKVLFMSRPGGLVGAEGVASFSTAQVLAFEDMSVEQFDDPKNRRIEGRVVDNSVPIVSSGLSGFYLANAFA